jgi:DNA gyrase inhibitor GyrI
MELTRQAGNEPPLVGLMKVFKDYYPDVIVGEVTSGRAAVFTVRHIHRLMHSFVHKYIASQYRVAATLK